MIKKIVLSALSMLALTAALAQKQTVLVFSKTEGYRHTSIEQGKTFFDKLGKEKGIQMVFSENADVFTEENLKSLSAVVFLSTTGNILNSQQQTAFERYIQSGGGFMGIHAATDTEYDWPWYNGLVGAYFASHPGGNVSNVQEGEMVVIDKEHPSTKHLPITFTRKDEFYDFKSLKKDQLNFLIEVDEKTYLQGKMGDFHPMAWFQDYDGGKAFYTNFGHTDETFTDPLMTKHLQMGLESVMSERRDYSKAYSIIAPEENRYIRTNLIDNLDEPTELAILPDGKVIFVQRKGEVKVWDPAKGIVASAGQMPVYTKFEYGLMGIGVDPNFEQNNWIYLYYTPETTEHKDNFLSRFEFDLATNSIKMESEKVVLRVPVKRVECCHTGGSIDWDSKGNLYLSTGDDTNPFASDGYAPIDFREGRSGWDALRSSGNTNDLRGKILRITPTADGSYTIPNGNLFPVGTPKTKPEIFVMGCRNPYRISVDPQTDYLYWGDIGPDAGKANPDRGPEGQVEFNQARTAGNYGWPLFVGDNDAYKAYNFDTKQSGESYDPAAPINNSPNNTGLRELPPSKLPFIWYGYGESEQFPALGKGGANPMAGPIYHYNPSNTNPNKLPQYLDNKLFIYEWMRDWVLLVSLDENGNYKSMEPFMPNSKFYHPMDMAISKNGELFVLDYGMGWFSKNKNASLSKITFNSGNRTPVAKLKASKIIGSVPLKVTFSSEGSVDYDGDPISYKWTFGTEKISSKEAKPTFTFQKAGLYEVKLTVSDSEGNSSTAETIIKVGNEEPEIDIAIDGNSSFFLGQEEINYTVGVKDKEDGSLSTGIKEEDVIVSIDFLEGYDQTMIAQGHQKNLSFSSGKRLIEKSDCAACHAVNSKSIGPSYTQIAKKYKKNNKNTVALANKIINGGGGVWGDQAMAAHPDLSENDAKSMVTYILSINDDKTKSLPIKGKYTADKHKGKKQGAYLIQATYTDNGGDVIGPLTTSKIIALKNPKINAVNFDESENTAKFDIPQMGEVVIVNDNSTVKFSNIDFEGITQVKLGALGQKGQTAGGKVELRLGSKEGEVIGEAQIKEANLFPLSVNLENLPKEASDLVLVFKNPSADGKPLFAFSFIEFKK